MSDYEEAMKEAIELGLMTKNGDATDRCQCTGCGLVFSTEANFTKHRVHQVCNNPTDQGFIRTRGVWHQPGPEDPIVGRGETVGLKKGAARVRST